MRFAFRLALLLVLAAGMPGQEFAGTGSCAGCHSRQTRSHAAGMHARALRPAFASHASALFDRPVREASGAEFHYTLTPQGLRVTASARGSSRTALIEWIFGAGLLAFTPVGRDGDVYFEHRVSWYSASQRPGMTLGHPIQPPPMLIGQPQRPEVIYTCFNCHATGVKPGPDLSAMQPGVQCERCHGAAAAHVRQPGITAVRPRRLAGLPRSAAIAVCAECHRMPEAAPSKAAAPELSDPMSIRFAPVGLMASRCYLSGAPITCVTCHDPHSGPRPTVAAYEERCRGCHTAASSVASRCARPGNTACLSCHMRKATPVPDLTFTDHRIRVYPELRN